MLAIGCLLPFVLLLLGGAAGMAIGGTAGGMWGGGIGLAVGCAALIALLWGIEQIKNR